MKQSLALSLVLAISIVPILPGNACTIFTVTNRTQVLVGNNEDWCDPDSKVWFLQPRPGKHGRIYFGFKNGWTQGGMNDQGLFFDWVYMGETESASQTGKVVWSGNLCEKILEEAATVQEALSYYQKYHESSFATSRIMFVDATGDAAIIGWENRQVRIWRKEGAWQILGAEERARIVREHLQKKAELSVDEVASVLSEVTQRGQHPTRYSAVYDLKRRVVSVFDPLNRKKLGVFELSIELAKDDHYYDLPRLPEQLSLLPLADGRALRPVQVDPALLPQYAGTYQSDTGVEVVISAEQGKLFSQVGSPMKYELVPASDRIFFLPFTDAQAAFLYDAQGRIGTLVVLQLQGAKRDMILHKLKSK